MRRQRFRVIVIALQGFSIFACAFAVAAEPSDFLTRHCIRCHGADSHEADLRLDRLDAMAGDELTKRWHHVYTRVSEHQMPPEDEPQPSAADREQFLEWIRQAHGRPTPQPLTEHWSLQPMVRPKTPADLPHAPALLDAFVRRKLQEAGLSYSPATDRRTLLRRVSLDLIGLPPSTEEMKRFLDDSASLDVAFSRVVDRLLASQRYGERWAQHWLDVIRWAETVGFETNLERPHAWHYRDWVIKALNDDMPYDRFIFEQVAGDTVGADAALGFLVAGPANLPGQIGRDEEAMRQARQDELDEVIRTVSESLFGLTIGCARCHDHKFDPISQRDYYAMQAIFAGLTYGDRRLRGEENDQWTARLPDAERKLAELREELERWRVDHHLRPAVSEVTTEKFQPVKVDAARMEIGATSDGAASLYEFEVLGTRADEPGGTPMYNVALAIAGARPSASSFALENQTRHPDNLIDGSVDPRQAYPWKSATSGPAWVQIDLAEPAVVSRAVWHAGSSTPTSYELKLRDADSGEWQTVAHTRDRLPMTIDSRDATQLNLEGVSAEQASRLVNLLAQIRRQQAEVLRLAAGPQTYAAQFNQEPDDTWLLRRGDPMQRGEKTLPLVPAVLRGADREITDTTETARRLSLVRHLTSADHPLTARVIVNRVWQHHFGTGLVKTSSDFGRMGAKPSHPELLDWLAMEFIDNGWSLKWLHRQIVLSQTYQQASVPRADAMAVDAECRLLWRFPPRRLDAEAIRDSILATSGKLNLKMYGRGFDFFDQRGGLADYTPRETFDDAGWRRMVYAHKIRMQSVDIFGAFDCPDAGQMSPRRNRSITPVQSLVLFNSPFLNRQAQFFAGRVQSEVGSDAGFTVDRVFEIALARLPNSRERRTLLELAEQQGLDQVCRVVLNSSEFVFLR